MTDYFGLEFQHLRGIWQELLLSYTCNAIRDTFIRELQINDMYHDIVANFISYTPYARFFSYDQYYTIAHVTAEMAQFHGMINS
ncbi:hypothetical protein DUI87_11637 [Hirundo rustica rustica]|uniref:Uncharacterized protein n=1 Tax=Hirundo rustica rustica TaxID=333673 RepID=A0A3M0KE43_HIRRU|nr:hypothetical protein DUI87_11637 [Hirundo rustica rustica]